MSCARSSSVLVLVALLASTVYARIFTADLTWSPDDDRVSGVAGLFNSEADAFGFDNEGVIDIEMTCDSVVNYTRISLFILSESDMKRVWDQPNMACSVGSIESATSEITLATSTSASNTKVFSARRPAERNVFRQAALFICPGNMSGSTTHTCHAILTLTNAGGSHLSSDEATLPELQRNLAIAVGILLLLWFSNWIRWYQMDNRLHHALAIPPLFKLIFLSTSSAGTLYIRHHGVPDVGLQNTAVVFEAFENTSLMLLLMLMAEGWCITWRVAPGYLPWMTGILCVTLLSAQLCTRWVHRYFAGLAVLDLIVIFVYLLRSSGFNIHMLRQRFFALSAVLDRIPVDSFEMLLPLRKKSSLFRHTRHIFVVYAVIWTLFGIVSGYLTHMASVQFMAFSALDVSVYASLAILYRLRDFRRFLHGTAANAAAAAEAQPPALTECQVVQNPGGRNVMLAIPDAAASMVAWGSPF